MREKLADHLAPWILAPLLLPFLLFFVTSLVAVWLFPELPGGDDYDDWSTQEVVTLAVLALSDIAVAMAGLFRMVTLARRRRYGKRDGWILFAILLAFLLANLSLRERVVDTLLVGAFPLTGISLLALAIAALVRKRVDDVGILLPIYLFGVAYVYLWMVLFSLAGEERAFS